MKRLGGRRWNRLHKLVYVAAAGGVLHYLWLVKADTRRPIVFGLILVTLLAVRLWRPRKRVADRPNRNPVVAQRGPRDELRVSPDRHSSLG